MKEQQNMQITETKRKTLQELNLMDDFMFDAATVNLDVCRIIIELSLGIKIKNIYWKEGQKVIHNLPGKRGIRMDFYVEDVEGRVFNVEMQKRNEGNIPKRTRFYQALVDAPLLKSGERGFDNLNQTYIIVICGFDLFGCGLYRYTFENRCLEQTNLTLGDGTQKVILNTKGKNDDEVEKPLRDFLRYVEHSDDASVPDDCDERIKYLHKVIGEIKSSEQMGVTYMKMEERDRLIKEDGKAEGEELKLIKLVCKKLQKKCSVPEIADMLEEEESTIQRICDVAAKFAPDYDVEAIYENLKM